MKLKTFIIVSLSSLVFLSCKPANRINKHTFKTPNEAMSFFMTRRLDYLRYYELTSEAYFGKPAEKECHDNIEIGATIQTTEKKAAFYFIKAVEDDSGNITDCLIIDKRRNVFIYSIACAKNEVFIIKSFEKIPNHELDKMCSQA